jgi:hypothetical protein
MQPKHKTFLLVDGAVNLILGILLLAFPLGVPRLLGLPLPESNFYPTILGGVIFGIGIALLVETFGQAGGVRGLGLGGAIAINLCGAGVLIIWLVSEPLAIPLRGYIILWVVATVVSALGVLELVTKTWRYD